MRAQSHPLRAALSSPASSPNAPGRARARRLAGLAHLRPGERFTARYSRSHPNTVPCLGNRAGLPMRSNQIAAARIAHCELIPLQIEAIGADSPLVGFARVRLGQLLIHQGDAAGAAELRARAAALVGE